MNDLISRNKVIEILKETGIIQDNDLGHLVVGEIERIPKVYDAEKVVEQLMIVHDEGYCPSETLECVLDRTCSDCYREKITEIVRKGCV